MLYASVIYWVYNQLIFLLFLIFHSIVYDKKHLNEAIDCSEVIKVPLYPVYFDFLP